MPSDPTIPVGTTRFHLPGMRDQQGQSASPSSPFPLAEFIVTDTSATTVLAKNARTQVPLVTGTPTSGRAFCEFAASHLDAANSRIMPVTSMDLLTARFTVQVVRDGTQTAATLAALMTTLAGTGPLQYVLNSLAAVHLDVDTASAYGPIFATTEPISALPAVIGMTVPLYGAATFLANGAKVYATSSITGLAVTDARVFLVQGR